MANGLQYTIHVNEAGTYDPNLRTAAVNNSGKVKLEVNGKSVKKQRYCQIPAATVTSPALQRRAHYRKE